MPNVHGSRKSTSYIPADRHAANLYFVASIICDAVKICNGEKAASDEEIEDCKAFLQSERCERWLNHLNIEVSCVRRITDKTHLLS